MNSVTMDKSKERAVKEHGKEKRKGKIKKYVLEVIRIQTPVSSGFGIKSGWEGLNGGG